VGTVREIIAPGAPPGNFFHTITRAPARIAGEDGIGGISDRHQMICLGWRYGTDAIHFEERLFGLTGNQGNHGEDVKEYYFYSIQLHAQLHAHALQISADRISYETRGRKWQRDKGVRIRIAHYRSIFRQSLLRYFRGIRQADVEDMLIRITAVNRGPESRHIADSSQLLVSKHVGPGARICGGGGRKSNGPPGSACVELQHWNREALAAGAGEPQLLFTENETNNTRLFRRKKSLPYVKDAFTNM